MRTAFIALLSLAAAAPAADAGSKKMLWGQPTLADGRSAFPTYQDLGVDVLQMQLPWREVAGSRPGSPRDPTDPAYRWPTRVDLAVSGAATTGMRVSLLVKTTPDWANGGRGAARVPNRDRDYADFLVAAARRYPTVREWMIWGEPQRGDSFEPMPRNKRKGPRRYARLLDRAYRALKAHDRSLKVIGGNTWTFGVVSPVKFLRWMRLPNGKPPRLDYYGHNPFSVRFPNIDKKPYRSDVRDMSDVDTLSRQLRRVYRKRGRKPKLWLSEFTVSSEPNNTFNFHVSPAEQADWLTAAFRIADRARYVAGMGWFQLQDAPNLPLGLLDRQGERKPAYAAFRSAP